jgi:hypothetical protein
MSPGPPLALIEFYPWGERPVLLWIDGMSLK